MSSKIERKLTTILAADAEGYSRRMEADEVGTFAALHKARAVFAKFIERHNGRIANTAGDALIADFPSVVEAVACAIEVQQELGEGHDTPGGELPFRIGIHLGDVIIDGEDLLGEGVNLAARLQAMADPGGILVSRQVYDHVGNKLTVGFEYLGEKRPKNFSDDVSVYRVSSGKNTGKHQVFKPDTRMKPTPQETKKPMPELRNRVLRQAKIVGLLGFAFIVMDLMSGNGSFAIYPIIVMATLLGWRAAPLWETESRPLLYVRVGVILAGLTLMNFATWSGSFWAFWPILVAGVAIGIYRLMKRAG